MDAASSTIVDCGGTSRFITFNNSEPPSVALIGITLRNCGSSPDGRGAVFIDGASPTFKYMSFEDNIAERGGTVVAQGGGRPAFEWCSFKGSKAQSGCPASCTLAMRKDDVCDFEVCGYRQCGFDKRSGSCCPTSCAASAGDGTCNPACNNAECGYDRGDCCENEVFCTTSRGDGNCDSRCNNAACGYDGGDCAVDKTMMWGGYELAEHVGFDGFSKGGVGLFIGGAKGIFKNCTFENSAADLGGAFYIQGCDSSRATDAPCVSVPSGETSSLELQDCNATGASAVRGGFIYVAMRGKVTVSNLRLSGTKVEEQGGLVWSSKSDVTVTGGELAEYEAADGAALYLSDSVLKLDGTDLRNGMSGGASGGGAIVLTDGSRGELLGNCTITNSSADHGGGIRVISTEEAEVGSGRLETYPTSKASTLAVDTCTLRDNSASKSGGAIDIVGSSSRKSSVMLNSVTLDSNKAIGGDGGCIAIQAGELDVDSSEIDGSQAARGGAVFAKSSSKVRMASTKVRDSSATERGGALHASGGSVDLTAGTLLSNASAIESGGAATLLDGVVAVVENVTIEESFAKLGGGIELEDSNLTVRAARLLNNRGHHGAGLHAKGGAKGWMLRISDSDITGNNATIEGGGLVLKESAELELNDTTLMDNGAGLGGAMFIHASGFKIVRSKLSANKAARGAAAYILSKLGGATTPSIESSVFDSNKATRQESVKDALDNVETAEGGALFMYSAGKIQVCCGSKFLDNQAESGAAIAVVANSALNMSDSDVSNNTALVDGGGVKVALAMLLSTNNTFSSNSAKSGGALSLTGTSSAECKRDTYLGSSAVNGAMADVSGSTIEMEDTTIESNKASGPGTLLVRAQSSAKVTGTTFKDNTASRGGGVSVQDSDIELLSSNFSDNTAIESGGAVQLERTTKAVLTALQATGNIADEGGAIFASHLQGTSLKLRSSELKSNRARVGGGAYIGDTSDVEIEDSKFEANEATDLGLTGVDDDILEVEGGGMYCARSDLVLINDTWKENDASSDNPLRASGGALAAHACSSQLKSQMFDSNRANEAGGVLWRGSYAMKVYDGVFKANKAHLNKFSDAVLWGSDAGAGSVKGGGIEWKGCTNLMNEEGQALDYGEGCDATRRKLQSGSISMFGVATPVDRLEWWASPRWDPLGGVAVSGQTFPNITLVHAIDAYGNTVPTAAGSVTARAANGDDLCETPCIGEAQLVNGIATFTQLGLVAMPGTTSSITFESTKGNTSTPMLVAIADCPPGKWLDSTSKLCRPCEPGKYSGRSGAVSCDTCASGTFMAATGATACTTCAAGQFAASEGTLSCGICGAGTQSTADRKMCTGCSPGTYAERDGAANCTQCNAGLHQPQVSAKGCILCAAIPASYSITGASNCTECHEGADCSYQQFHGALKGWWAYRPVTFEDGGKYPADLYKVCKIINGFKEDRCLGGFNSVCREGHQGPLCAVCQPRWYKAKDYCESCDAVKNGTLHIFGQGIETVGYDAKTHAVAYRLHVGIAFIMGSITALVMVIVFCCTSDPLANKKKKNHREDEGGDEDALEDAALAIELEEETRTATRKRSASISEKKDPGERRPSRLGIAFGRTPKMAVVSGDEGASVLKEEQEAPAKQQLDLPATAPDLPQPSSSIQIAEMAEAPPQSEDASVDTVVFIEQPREMQAKEPAPGNTQSYVAGLFTPSSNPSSEMRSESRPANLFESASMFFTHLVQPQSERPPPAASPAPSAPPSPPPSPPSSPRAQADLESLGATPNAPKGFNILGSFKEKMKILITHFQIMLSFRTHVDMQFPKGWNVFGFSVNFFSWVQIDAIDLMRLDCIQPVNAYDALFASTIGATVMALAIPITVWLLLARQSRSWRKGWSEPTPAVLRTRVHFINRAWNVGLCLLFFLFAPVTQTAFQTMHCQEMEPGKSFMLADLSIPCWDATHSGWVVFALVAIAFYTFGIPMFFFWILYINQRKLVLQTPRVESRFGFLYSTYRDDRWYWELLEMFRKLIFTSVIMFLSAGTSVQIVQAMLLAFFFLVAHLSQKAYKDRSDFLIQSISMICIFLTLLLGLCARTEIIYELDLPGSILASDVFKTCTLIVEYLPAVTVLALMLVQLVKLLAQLESVSSMFPNLGCGQIFQLTSGGGDLASNQRDMLTLALAVNTAEAGAVAAAALHRDPTADAHLNKKEAKKQKKLDVLTKYTLESRVLHRAQSIKGEPVVEEEKYRKLFLKSIRVTQTAIVLRHWPIGKGFILRAPAALMAEAEQGRPPYIFVKIWNIRKVDDGRLAEVQYDVRDIGALIDRDDVINFPDDANKELLLWEHAQKVADGRLPPSEASVATAARQLKSVDKVCCPAQPNRYPLLYSPRSLRFTMLSHISPLQAGNKFKTLLKDPKGSGPRALVRGSTVSRLQRRASKIYEAGVKI